MERKKETTTDKNIKVGFTRHTIQIKKDHLKILQALSIYTDKSITDIIEEIIDTSIAKIDNKTLTKALALYEEQRNHKNKSIFEIQ